MLCGVRISVSVVHGRSALDSRMGSHVTGNPFIFNFFSPFDAPLTFLGESSTRHFLIHAAVSM